MTNQQPPAPLDPESLVARIIAELQANPHAQRLLLRALLTHEFLGVPARLDRIEKDIAELKAEMNRRFEQMAEKISNPDRKIDRLGRAEGFRPRACFGGPVRRNSNNRSESASSNAPSPASSSIC